MQRLQPGEQWLARDKLIKTVPSVSLGLIILTCKFDQPGKMSVIVLVQFTLSKTDCGSNPIGSSSNISTNLLMFTKLQFMLLA